MAASGTRLVVMSGVAAELLARRYELRGAPVQIIPHGIPDMAPRSQTKLKAKFGVSGHRMMLTFGLLGPNKGIETVLRALPAAIAAFPDLVYFVVGATHPAIVKQHGEAYRTTLEREAEALGVRDHVVFRDQYVTTDELCSYLQATDLFVSPYLNEAQVTSGALSYAMGAGAAVLSTPYWHAKELLARGAGGCSRSATARRWPARSPRSSGAGGAGADPGRRIRVHPRVHLARRRRALPGAGRDGHEQRPQAQPAGGAAREQPAGARLDHLAADDRRHRHHPARDLHRAARASGYCVDDNARGADRRAARRPPAAARPRPTAWSRPTSAFCFSAQTEDGRF
jgi:hypothetical protein